MLPSLKVPAAENNTGLPTGADGIAGVTESDTSVAFVTVRVVAPVTKPAVAEMEVVPAPLPIAKPPLGVIVATWVAEELQVIEVSG